MSECAVVGIHHVQLAMPLGGEAAARHFYSGLLGMPEIKKPVELAKRGGIWFETGSVRIHLGVEPDFRAARKAHPGLLVHDLKALTTRLAGAGYEVASGEPLQGYEHLYVNDPFGNRLELLEAIRANSLRSIYNRSLRFATLSLKRQISEPSQLPRLKAPL